MGDLFDYQLRFAELLTRADTRSLYRASSTARERPAPYINDKFAVTLVNLRWDRVEQFSELLVVNRLGKAIDGLPWTMRALRHQSWDLALDFNERYPPRFSKVFREALLFCNYLLNAASDRIGFNEWILDLALYEGASLEVRFQEYIQPIDRLVLQAGSRSISSSNGGMLAPCARLVRTAHNVCAIGEELDEDEETIHRSALEVDPCCYIFWRKSDGSFASKELNPAMMALLELAATCANAEDLWRLARAAFSGRVGVEEASLSRAIDILRVEEIIAERVSTDETLVYDDVNK